jgi:hypothetical protein
VKFLSRKCQQAKWFEPPEDEWGVIDGAAQGNLGVLLRRPDGVYTADPMFLNRDIVSAVERLGAAVAFTMSSDIVWSLFDKITPLQQEIPLDRSGNVLPLAKSVRDVGTPRCTATRESYVCFCREERFLLIWGTTPQSILAHGNDVETTLLGLVSSSIHQKAFRHLPILGMGIAHTSPRSGNALPFLSLQSLKAILV